METYASVEYYRNTHKGAFSGSDEQLERLLFMASRRIDGLTYNRIVRAGFDNLTDFRREMVQMACCFQADYYDANGVDSQMPGVNSYTVLDLSVTLADHADMSTAARARFSEMGYELLQQTGLTSGVFG